jgi:hypothetical protein
MKINEIKKEITKDILAVCRLDQNDESCIRLIEERISEYFINHSRYECIRKLAPWQ